MAKKKAETLETLEQSEFIFAVSGNLADGTRFNKGDKVTDLSDDELEALQKMNAIEVK